MLHPLPAVTTPVQDPWAAPYRSATRISSSDREPRLRTERLWHEYFIDPYIRVNKMNLKAPDFMHKSSKESLWIDGWHNPGWVTEMFEEKESESWESQGISAGKQSRGYEKQEQACSNTEEADFARSGFRLGGQEDVSKVQQPPEASNWEMLSLEEALSILDRMDEVPSIENVINSLQKCRKDKSLAYAKRVHAHIYNCGLESHKIVGNYIVPMFVECGSVHDAQQVFNRLAYRNEHSWTSLILGYIECGQSQRAFNLYQKMQEDNVHPSSYTLVALLKACARLKDLERGREMHADITKMGYERNGFVGNTLVDMYAKCGSLVEAREVFDCLLIRSVVSWNALITGYTEHGPAQEALRCIEQMQLEGVLPDAATFMCILKACGSIGAIDKGRLTHADIAQRGFERDVFVGSTLVDMYAKCGLVAEAREAFENLPVRNVVSWNALITGYAEHGPGQEALECFEQMQEEGVSPNAVTCVCVLKACGSIGALDKGREIHKNMALQGFERDAFAANTLVNMYAKCGSLSEALEVFDKLPVRDVVSWTALIAGYAEHGPGQEALKCFERMQLEGISPNAITFVCVLKACGNLCAIEKGREVHADIAERGYDGDLLVGNTLVDMYVKCGSISEAQQIFDKLPVRDVMSWSSMIKGYGMNHEGNMALQCFEDMQKHGVRPDEVTFTCLLIACSRANLVREGQEFFIGMREAYCIAPTMDHYTCMVDLLAQSGHLYQAENFLETMPCPPSKETWMALLSACKIYGEAELGLRCFQQLVQMNPECAAPYVLMAKIYATDGKWDDAYRIEELRKRAGAKKKPASALIEVDKKVHEFLVGNQSKEISAMLESLSLRMKEEGHVPNVNLVLRPILDGKKEVVLCEHAERLAIAFGLLNTPEGQTLRVTKNLRMCNDCHSSSKLISRIERREIIVRDIYHIHHFKDGNHLQKGGMESAHS